MRFRINGGALDQHRPASQSGLADGDYQFRAVVTDPAGNSSTSNAIEVIVDNTDADRRDAVLRQPRPTAAAADSDADHPGRHLRSQPERQHRRQRHQRGL